MVTLRASKTRVTLFLFLLCHLGSTRGVFPAETEHEPLVNPPAAPAVSNVSPDVAAVMDHLEPLWENMRTDIVSSDAKFQIYYQIKPQTPLTSSQIHEKLDQYPFVNHPENVAAFLKDISGPEASFVAPVHHLLEQGEWTRHEAGPATYVHVADYSFVVEHDNKQIHIYDPGRTPTTAQDLMIFRTPMKTRADGHLPSKAERDGQVVHLESINPPSHRRGTITAKSTIDWATGVPLFRSHSLDSTVLQETVYSGLTTFSGGVTLPQFCTTIRYEQNRVASVELAVLGETKFNEPIPEQAFLLGKPTNWKLLDFRGDTPGMEIHTPAEAVADVRTLIPESTNQPHSIAATQLQQITPMSIPMRAVLILNGTALIALGVWMWKQASLGGQKH